MTSMPWRWSPAPPTRWKKLPRRSASKAGRPWCCRSNPNNLGAAWHLTYFVGRVGLGFTLALLVVVPLSFLLGLWPVCYRTLDPFTQGLRPASPLAWLLLALYTFRESAISTIFIIFMIFLCAVWPTLISTASGTASVRVEWLNISRVSGLPKLEHVTRVVFPASVSMSLSGTPISIGIAWFVVVAAEMVGA